eukprot:2060967-Pleurochrysis_carterae.AAC.1
MGLRARTHAHGAYGPLRKDVHARTAARNRTTASMPMDVEAASLQGGTRGAQEEERVSKGEEEESHRRKGDTTQDCQ